MVERVLQVCNADRGDSTWGGLLKAIRALSGDLDYIEREKLKARREERDVVGAFLDYCPASLDGRTWGFFIADNDDRREELDRQLAALSAVTP
jgi:hypothetical protein